jgi:GPI mannosyltransferase 3
VPILKRMTIAGWLGRGEVPAVTHALRRSVAIIGAVTLVTAYFSEGYFQLDEHYQVLEFLAYKLGVTSVADLPWEFNARIRPWLQPFLYFLIAKPLTLAGIRDLFAIDFVLRLMTALASLAALAAFANAAVGDFARLDEKLWYARSLPFFGFLPYLFVRTSSETLSAAFFTLGLALAMAAPRGVSGRRFAAVGILFGLAFECRFQSGILVAGLFFWLALVARVRLAPLVALASALLVPIVLALGIDRWGYGSWCFPPWGYVRENLVSDAARTEPFYAYFYLMPANIFLPIVASLVVALPVAWLRNPRHAITWTTLPFVLVHSFIGNKQERFLFPMAILATAFPVLAFAASDRRGLEVFDRLWKFRRSVVVKIIATLSVAAMAFLALYPFGSQMHTPMAKYAYRHFPDELVAYSFDENPFRSYPMYRPLRFEVQIVRDSAALDARLVAGPVYLFSRVPSLDDSVLPQNVRATLLYSELPFAGYPGIANFGTWTIRRYNGLRALWPRLPDLAWMTLFRLDRAAIVQ